MINPLNISIVTIGALICGVFTVGAVKDIQNAPEPYMALTHLSYENGAVSQAHSVKGINNMPAAWEAWVVIDGDEACRGGSQGPTASYHDNERSTFSVDVWVGDDCPDKLPSGAELRAVWTYEINGHERSIAGTFTVP